MSSNNSKPAAANYNDDSDSDSSDDEALPVIAIDGLRAVLNPEQVRNRNQHVPGLQVGGCEPLFELDEEDPLLQTGFQNNNNNNNANSEPSQQSVGGNGASENNNNNLQRRPESVATLPRRVSAAVEGAAAVGAVARNGNYLEASQQKKLPAVAVPADCNPIAVNHIPRRVSTNVPTADQHQRQQGSVAAATWSHRQQQPVVTTHNTAVRQRLGQQQRESHISSNGGISSSPMDIDNVATTGGGSSHSQLTKRLLCVDTQQQQQDNDTAVATTHQDQMMATQQRLLNTFVELQTSRNVVAAEPIAQQRLRTSTGTAAFDQSTASASRILETLTAGEAASRHHHHTQQCVPQFAAPIRSYESRRPSFQPPPQQQPLYQPQQLLQQQQPHTSAVAAPPPTAALNMTVSSTAATANDARAIRTAAAVAAAVQPPWSPPWSPPRNATRIVSTVHDGDQQQEPPPPPLTTTGAGAVEQKAAASNNQGLSSTTITDHAGRLHPQQQEEEQPPIIADVSAAPNVSTTATAAGVEGGSPSDMDVSNDDDPNVGDARRPQEVPPAATTKSAAAAPNKPPQKSASSEASVPENDDSDDLELAALHRHPSAKTGTGAAASRAGEDAYHAAAVVSSPASTADDTASPTTTTTTLAAVTVEDGGEATTLLPEHEFISELAERITRAQEEEYEQSLSSGITALEEAEYIRALSGRVAAAEAREKQQQQAESQRALAAAATENNNSKEERGFVNALAVDTTAAKTQQNKASSSRRDQSVVGAKPTAAVVSTSSAGGSKQDARNQQPSAKSKSQQAAVATSEKTTAKPRPPVATTTAAVASKNQHESSSRVGGSNSEKESREQKKPSKKKKKKTSAIPRVTMMKRIPRLLPGDDSVFLSRRDFESSNPPPSGVEFRLERIPNAPESWNLHVQGPRDVAKHFMKSCETTFKNKMIRYNFKRVVSDGVELELELSGSQKLGANLTSLGSSNGCAGCNLIVVGNAENGQLARAIGHENSKYGAGLMTVNGKRCRDIDDFKMLTKTKKGKKYRLVLRVSRDVDLSKLNQSMVKVAGRRGEQREAGGGVGQQQGKNDAAGVVASSSSSVGVGGTKTVGATSERVDGGTTAKGNERAASTGCVDSNVSSRELTGAAKSSTAKQKPSAEVRPHESTIASKRISCGTASKDTSAETVPAVAASPRAGAVETCNVEHSEGANSKKRKGTTEVGPSHLPCKKARHEQPPRQHTDASDPINSYKTAASPAQHPSRRKGTAERKPTPSQPVVGLERSPPTEPLEGPKESSSQAAEGSKRRLPDTSGPNSRPAETRQSYPPQSNVQPGRQNSIRARKSVRFSGQNEIRWFVDSHPVTGCLLNEDPGELRKISPSPLNQRRGSLDDAIRRGSISELHGHLVEEGVSENKLKAMRSLTKELMFDAKKLTDGTRDEQLRAMVQKDKLLKIYINAFHIVRASKMLKHWERLEVKFQGVEGLQPIDSSLEHSGCQIRGEVYSVSGDKKERLHEIPPQPLQSVISFSTDLHPYSMNFNVPLCPERCLEVNLLAARPDGSSQTLGTVLIKMSEVHKGCPAPGQGEKGLVFESTGSDAASSFSFKTRVRRTGVSAEYLDGKRATETKRLKNVMEWINRFNEERLDTDQLQLISEIRVVDKESLLHAAVLLQDPDVVNRLLRAGADPSAKSGRGSSAFSWAQNMADGCAEEVRRERMEKIVDLLKEENRSRREKEDQRIAAVVPRAQEAAQGSPAQNATSRSDTSRTVAARTSEVSLPRIIDANWLTQSLGENVFCRSWERHRKCSFPDCRFVHVQQRWSWQFRELLDQARAGGSTARILKPNCIHFRRGQDSNGRWWFTAAYSTIDISSKKDQFVFYAEGGPTAKLDEERGLTWYPSQDDAREALESVVLVSDWARRRGKIVPPSPPRRGSASRPGPASRGGRPMGDTGGPRGPTPSTGSFGHNTKTGPKRDEPHVHTAGNKVAAGASGFRGPPPSSRSFGHNTKTSPDRDGNHAAGSNVAAGATGGFRGSPPSSGSFGHITKTSPNRDEPNVGTAGSTVAAGAVGFRGPPPSSRSFGHKTKTSPDRDGSHAAGSAVAAGATGGFRGPAPSPRSFGHIAKTTSSSERDGPHAAGSTVAAVTTGGHRGPPPSSGSFGHVTKASPDRDEPHVRTTGRTVAGGGTQRGFDNSRKRKGPPSHEEVTDKIHERQGVSSSENYGPAPHRPRHGPYRVMRPSDSSPPAPHRASVSQQPEQQPELNAVPSGDNAGPPLVSATINIMTRVPNHWIEAPSKRSCKFFESGHCKFGQQCKNLHIQFPNSRCFSDENVCGITMDDSGYKTFWGEDTRKRHFVTCKYQEGNVLRYAQGRSGGEKSRGYWDKTNKLWWYRLLGPAEKAIVSFKKG